MVRLLALRALRFSRFLLPSAVPTLFAVIVSLRPSGELLRTRDPRGGDLGKKASSGLKCDDGTRCSLVAEVRLDVVVLLSEAVTLGASKGGITLLHICPLDGVDCKFGVRQKRCRLAEQSRGCQRRRHLSFCTTSGTVVYMLTSFGESNMYMLS